MKDSTTLIFMGLKHCGKSRLGRRIADSFGLFFEDLDHLIMYTAGHEGYPTIRELYRAAGLSGFQAYETAALADFFDTWDGKGLLLSLGGGTAENTEAMEIAALRGYLVYLAVDEQVLYDRIIAGGIPPFLRGESGPRSMFHKLYLRRADLYRRFADLEISLPDQSVEKNTELIQSFLKEKIHVR